MSPQPLIVGSRESPLAQVQARAVMAMLAARFPDQPLALRTFKTQGDIHLEQPISELGDKGLFVKELEVALLAGEIAVAVHSLKDMPADLPPGLALRSAGEREDPRDVLVSRGGVPFAHLPVGARVGTSSLRRIAQLRRLRPDLHYAPVRGNVQTRLRKLDAGDYDALVLAAAGIRRSGLSDRVTQAFDPIKECIPAPGQGILAVEFRAEDRPVAQLLTAITDPATQTAMDAERAVLRALNAGCRIPMGAHACPEAACSGAESWRLSGVLFDEAGEAATFHAETFAPARADEAGTALARALRPV